MRLKIRYILIIVVIVLALGVTSLFIDDRDIFRSSLPPVSDSPTAERNYKFKLSPPDPSRTTEETQLLMNKELAERAYQLFAEKNLSIVAIGDSLTQGVGDETEQGGYVGILDRLLNKEQPVVSFTNLGKRGQRSDQLLDRLQETEVTAALSDADFIIISIGANDLMKVARENMTNLHMQVFVEERAHYAQRLQQIFHTIRSINPKAHIYLLGIYNPFEKFFPHIKELSMIIDDYNHTGMTIVKRTDNSSFIPILDLFQNSTIDLLASDYFHPNYHGYVRIAGRVLEYLLLTGGMNIEEPEENPEETD